VSTDWYQDVEDWHQVFGVHIGSGPALPSEQVRVLRKKLVEEEYEEFCEAWEKNDLIELADAIADLVYVLNGTAISYGIDLRPVWDEVHRANMSKVGGSTREDGKILKPEGWLPPDIGKVLDKQKEEVLIKKEEQFFVWHEQQKGTLDGIECTCTKCPLDYKCVYAYDLYNLNGDCLAEK